MDRKYINDHHVVARYLADQLPDHEREAFEAYYLEHADVVEELEATARLKAGLAQLQDSGELAQLLRPKPWFQQPQLLALAASIALVAIGTFVWFGNRGSMTQPLLAGSASLLVDRSGQPLPLAATHVLMRMRGNPDEVQIELPVSSQAIALRVLPDIDTSPAVYRVVISAINADNSLHEIGAVGGLAIDSDGFVPVYLNPEKIGPGRYLLRLSGDAGTSAAAEASEFFIRIVDSKP